MGFWANLPIALAPWHGAKCLLYLQRGAGHGLQLAGGFGRGFVSGVIF